MTADGESPQLGVLGVDPQMVHTVFVHLAIHVLKANFIYSWVIFIVLVLFFPFSISRGVIASNDISTKTVSSGNDEPPNNKQIHT